MTAVDHDPHSLHQAQWAIARHGLQNRITLYQGRAYDLTRWRRRHDVVLLLDLLDRLRYPLLALDIAARLVKRCLVLQSRSTPRREAGITSDALSSREARETPVLSSWPKMARIERAFGEELPGGGTSNRAGVEAMLHAAGLEIVKRPGEAVYLCQPRAVDALELLRSEEELDAATGGGPDGFTRFDQRSAPASVRTESFVAAAAAPAA